MTIYIPKYEIENQIEFRNIKCIDHKKTELVIENDE